MPLYTAVTQTNSIKFKRMRRQHSLQTLRDFGWHYSFISERLTHGASFVPASSLELPPTFTLSLLCGIVATPGSVRFRFTVATAIAERSFCKGYCIILDCANLSKTSQQRIIEQ